jgi:hypothetical protein
MSRTPKSRTFPNSISVSAGRTKHRHSAPDANSSVGVDEGITGATPPDTHIGAIESPSRLTTGLSPRGSARDDTAHPVGPRTNNNQTRRNSNARVSSPRKMELTPIAEEWRSALGPRRPDGLTYGLGDTVKRGLPSTAPANDSTWLLEHSRAHESLKAGLREAHKPGDVIEQMIVDRMASLWWRLGLLQWAAQAHLTKLLEDGVPPLDAILESEEVSVPEERIHRSLSRAIRDLEFYQRTRLQKAKAVAFLEYVRKHPEGPPSARPAQPPAAPPKPAAPPGGSAPSAQAPKGLEPDAEILNDPKRWN